MPRNKIKTHGLQRKPDLDFRSSRSNKPKARDLKIKQPVFVPYRPTHPNPKMAFALAALLLLANLIEITAKTSKASRKIKKSSASKVDQKTEKDKATKAQVTQTSQKVQATHRILNPSINSRDSSCSPKVDFLDKQFIKQISQCLVEEEIYFSHQMVKNVAYIRDAKVVVLTEEHDNVNHHRLNKKLLNIIRLLEPKVKHTVLLEGSSNQNSFPCQNLIRCVYPAKDGAAGNIKNLRVNYDLLKKTTDRISLCKQHYTGLQKDPMTVAFGISKRFNCRGWESPEILTELRSDGNKFWDKIYPREVALGKLFEKMRKKFNKMDKFYFAKEKGKISQEIFNNAVQERVLKMAKLVENNSQWITHVDIKPEIQAIKSGQPFFIHAESMYKKIQEETRQATEERKAYISPALMIARNQAMIETIEKLKEKRGKIIIFSGYEHFFPATLKYDEPIPKEHSTYGLRNYLETIPSVITKPKAI